MVEYSSPRKRTPTTEGLTLNEYPMSIRFADFFIFPSFFIFSFFFLSAKKIEALLNIIGQVTKLSLPFIFPLGDLEGTTLQIDRILS